MLKTHILAAAVLALTPVVAARAADLPGNYAPAPVYQQVPAFTWTGFYAGLNAGGNWGSFTGGGGTFWGSPSGVVVGPTAGYNYQMGPVVLGLEADWDYDSARGGKWVAGPAYGVGKLTNELTLRGRAGFAADRALIYATGGYAGGTVMGSLGDASVPGYFTTSGWRNGYAIGAGIEYAFTNQISVKAEYLYSSFDKSRIFAPPRLSTAGLRESALRAGVNYHF